MVKYSLTFTGTAEALFGLLARLVPGDDLHIHAEEIADHSKFNHALVERRSREALPKPKRRVVPRASEGPNLKAGINGIIMTILSDGATHRGVEFRKPLKTAGYSESSVTSRIEELRKHGVVEKVGQGTWRLAHMKQSA